jgi:hypothetical protein
MTKVKLWEGLVPIVVEEAENIIIFIYFVYRIPRHIGHEPTAKDVRRIHSYSSICQCARIVRSTCWTYNDHC